MKGADLKRALKGIVFFIALTIGIGFNSSLLFAGVNVEDRTGTITITTPDGNVIAIEADEALPDIPSGSTIEVITGGADITATGGDSIDVVVNNATVTVNSGDSIAVDVNPLSGVATMTVLEGDVEVLQQDGSVKTVGKGGSFVAPALAPVTLDQLDVLPGLDPAGETGRQQDIEQGLVKGY